MESSFADKKKRKRRGKRQDAENDESAVGTRFLCAHSLNFYPRQHVDNYRVFPCVFWYLRVITRNRVLGPVSLLGSFGAVYALRGCVSRDAALIFSFIANFADQGNEYDMSEDMPAAEAVSDAAPVASSSKDRKRKRSDSAPVATDADSSLAEDFKSKRHQSSDDALTSSTSERPAKKRTNNQPSYFISVR